jgi:hypothetical protein
MGYKRIFLELNNEFVSMGFDEESLHNEIFTSLVVQDGILYNPTFLTKFIKAFVDEYNVKGAWVTIKDFVGINDFSQFQIALCVAHAGLRVENISLLRVQDKVGIGIWFFSSLFIVFVLALIAGIITYNSFKSLVFYTHTNQELSLKNSETLKVVKHMKKYRKTFRDFKKNLGKVEHAGALREQIIECLSGIAYVIPKNAWLEKFSCVGCKVAISGYISNYRELMSFYTEICHLPLLKKSRLSYEMGDLIHFVISPCQNRTF